MVTNQCKITILHSALKTAQHLLGVEVEFVQPTPVGHYLATSILRLANSTARNPLLPAVTPLFNGPPTRLFHGYYSPLCQKHSVSRASSEPFIPISKPLSPPSAASSQSI